MRLRGGCVGGSGTNPLGIEVVHLSNYLHTLLGIDLADWETADDSEECQTLTVASPAPIHDLPFSFSASPSRYRATYFLLKRFSTSLLSPESGSES